MPKILGIDYGDNKVGLALSDEQKKYAFARHTLINLQKSELFQSLASICEKENIEKVIVGLPLNQEGKMGKQAVKVQQFGNELTDFLKIPVEFEDERFSTAMAGQLFREASKKVRETKGIIDQQAAQIILQTYLDKQNG
jgi:putative Holliday junction resolvase